ncbi:MAG: lamin tail domain-containing protein [Pseudoxanthomonas sp.]|nr:lamin tail domain-containing protein [Pseudoxanthomonas sp.]
MPAFRLRGALVAVVLACSLASAPLSAQVVISQVYGGGGNAGALYTNDFIELFNAGSTPASLDGLQVAYASATGNTWNNRTVLPAVVLQPGQYFLIQQAAGTGGTQPLPTPDATGTIAMAAANGKVALVLGTDQIANATCPSGPEILDFVGFGTANCPVAPNLPTPALSNTTAALRNGNGCDDTGNNSADFTVAAPSPRNTATALAPCAGGGDLVLSIDSVSQAEGNADTTPMNFTVTLSGPAPAGGVAFTATTTDGTATAPEDFLALAEGFLIEEGETQATVSVDIVGDTVPEPDETFTVTIATSAAGVVVGTGTGTGTILNDDALVLEIFEIQGSGLRSPYAPASGNDPGQVVTTQANVVTALASNGFFMQTPDARDDDDPMTSNGIFVFTGASQPAQIGDVVDVTARVQEFFNWTQLTQAAVTVTASGAAMPTAVVLDETRPSPDPANLSCGDTNFECFENMLVHVPAGVVNMGNQRFASDLFGEAFVTASGERARREKGLLPTVVPPRPGLPVWDGNPEVFELDADGAGAVPVGTPVFGGELFSATGVISYQFGNYALRPVTLDRVPVDLPRPVPASGGDAELRIGSQNVLNLCVGGTCNPTQVARIAEQIGDVLGLPDVVGLQELGTATAGSVLATRLNTDYGTDYVAYTGSSPFPDGIRVGFLVKASRVAVVRTRNLDATVTIDQCSGTPPCALHDRPPFLLEATFTGGAGERFAVMNNHTRSFIGINDPAPAGDRVRFKRFEQGKSIGRLVQRFQAGQELEPANPVGGIDTQDVPLVLVGDYNTFEYTDGYVDVIGLIMGTYDDDENEYQLAGPNLVDPPLLNLVEDVPLEERYSYTFRESFGPLIGEDPRQLGNVQVLDHGLVNAAALPWCGGLVFGRGNADAPAELRNTGTGAVGSTDHDGYVVRLFTDRIGAYDFEPVGRCVR